MQLIPKSDTHVSERRLDMDDANVSDLVSLKVNKRKPPSHDTLDDGLDGALSAAVFLAILLQLQILMLT